MNQSQIVLQADRYATGRCHSCGGPHAIICTQSGADRVWVCTACLGELVDDWLAGWIESLR